MTALRWAAVVFLIAGFAAAPLNVLHARLFSGAELARVPLTRSGNAATPFSYAPLIITLAPEQSPVAVFLEAEFTSGTNTPPAVNRYITHLISGSQISAKADTSLSAGGKAPEPRAESLALLRTKINTAGLYTILVSESAPPAIALSRATLTVRANTRRPDAVNVLAGIAFILIGTVTLFATGKRRAAKPRPGSA